MTNQSKTLVGSIWSMIERFGYLGIQFVSNIVLSRLLSPNDFGTIGILLIFTSLSLVIIDSGFGVALIQKKDANDRDFSTVFYINVSLSIVVYIIIFILSPFIADYFSIPSLTSLIRVIELMVVVNAFGVVHNAILVRNIDIRKVALIKIAAIFISVIISIVCAILGMGVWALCVQNLSFSILRVILLWLVSKWRPSFTLISKDSFSKLWSFGSKLLCQQLLSEFYENFQSILIGKNFPPKDLGYFTQAKQLQQIPAHTLSSIVTSVSFPVYSQFQDDRLNLRSYFRKNMQILMSINTPMMFLLCAIAEPLFIFLYSSKWVLSVPYFQALCIGHGVFLIIHQSNIAALKAVGRSDYVLKLEIMKKISGFTLLILGMKYWGIWGIIIGFILNSVLELFLNTYYLSKEIDYTLKHQLIDLCPSCVLSIIASIGPFLLLKLTISPFLKILLGSAAFGIIYLLGAYIIKYSVFVSLINKLITLCLQKYRLK